MEKSESCSVCWEDFTEGEEVKLLECEHCFHEGCIVPWLELHGTCPGQSCSAPSRLAFIFSLFPVCRKELFKTGESPPGAEAGRGLDPLADDQPQPPAGVSGAAATGGAAAGGGAGLTGFIQSTLNQMFGGSGWTNPSPPPSHNHTSKLVLLLLSEPHQSWCVFADVSSSDSSSNAATSSQPQPQPPPRDSNGRVQTAELSLSPAPVKI